MTYIVNLDVHGVPFPQGSKSAFVRNGRATLVEGTSARARAGHAAWRQAVATAARDWLDEHPDAGMMQGPVGLNMAFRFPEAKSDPLRTLHTTRPDVDKLCRSVLDALVDGGLLRDDCHVAVLSARKEYAFGLLTPGASISVETLADEEARCRARRKERRAEERKAKRGAT